MSVNGKLTLIAAPAGFGKTTLVTAWIQQTGQPTAWLSLDENDNDAVRFLTYFVAGLQTVDDDLGATAVSLLQAPQPPPIDLILTSLINDIAPQTNHLTIVLDDYHLIQNKAIHDGLSFLLEHMPPQLHLIITTRVNPPLPLAKLRARGQMQEIRVQSLRFAVDEVAELFLRQLPYKLSQDDLRALAERTEGWITGLQLAAISLQQQAEPTTFIQSFTGSNQFILDYLLEEVLQQQPPHIQTFLMETAVLTQFSAPLCDAVLEQTNSQKILEHLQASNLFVISLDDVRVWFRYHHLFADLLLHRLQRTQPDHVQKLHQRACQWYEDNNLIDDALHHAQAISDYARAAQLIMDHAGPKMNSGELNVVFSWVNGLPDEQIRAHPFLAIKKAWQHLHSMQLQQIDLYLHHAETALASERFRNEAQTVSMSAELLAIRAGVLRYHGKSREAIQLGHEALLKLSTESVYARGVLLHMLGGAYRDEGETEAAIAAYTEALELISRTRYVERAAGIANQLSALYAACGQLKKGIEVLQMMFQRCPAHVPAIGGLHSGFSVLKYAQNDLSAALFHAQKTVELSQNDQILNQAHLTLARIHRSLGDTSKTRIALQEAEAVMSNWGTESTHILAGLKARFALLMNDLVSAERWQNAFDPQIGARFPLNFEFQLFTLVRTLTALGREKRDEVMLSNALKYLAQIEETAVSTGRRTSVMEAQLLRALVYDVMGQPQQAIDMLQEAVKLAESQGYQRLFLDEGQPMVKLLRQLPQTPFVVDLLSGFPETAVSSVNQDTLIEPLSDRELEVLRLLAQDYAYREMADELVVSLNTVRYHMKNIYTKLGANKKAQALTKAKDLNLI